MGANRWYEAYQEFVDFYNGPGSFAEWAAARRARFLDDQRKRGDLWDVLFEAPLTADQSSALSKLFVEYGDGLSRVPPSPAGEKQPISPHSTRKQAQHEL